MPARTITDKQEIELVNRYIAGESAVTISKDIGCSSATIYKYLRLSGVTPRTLEERKLPLNQEKFDILTPESLYWAGFMAADGSIYHQKGKVPYISLGLSTKDEDHVVKFKTFLESGHKLSVSTSKNSFGEFSKCQFQVRSSILADRLTNLGVKGPILSKELIRSRDFWRGVVDGDGSVSKRIDKPLVELYGYKYILEPFVEFLRESLGIYPKIHPRSSIYRVQIGGTPCARVLAELYSDADHYLDRKKERADAIIEHFQEKARIKDNKSLFSRNGTVRG